MNIVSFYPHFLLEIMPKTRMTALDVRACVNELKEVLLGSKVSNMFVFLNLLPHSYDVSNKVYIIKVVKKGIQYNLLLESGIRFGPCSSFPLLECIQRTI